MGGRWNIIMMFASKRLRGKPDRRPSCSAVIAAAGLSQRMDGEDKLFIEVCGLPVLAHTLLAFQNCEVIDEIIVVTRDDTIMNVGRICRQYGIDKAARVMAGGATRLESVMNGVFAVSGKAQLIAIHDGARPCIGLDDIKGAIAAAAKYHAAAPAVPVSSTLKRAKRGVVAETVDREGLFEVQTPQVFTAELIKAALTNAVKKSVDVTDDCMAVELIGAPVRLTEGSRSNIKLTTAEDIPIAEAILVTQGGAR
jgi:2-C-methyl-D-erythritol 4-phosphate cytidylyltransferase